MLNKVRNIYFLGVGGIGMSALARYFNAKGFAVAGYDKTESDLTMQLQREGIQVHYDDSVDTIPEDFKNPNFTLVVMTPAIPADLTELHFFRKNGFNVLKRSQVLGEITRSQRGICIAGTHGKTTTSTMTAHLLNSSSVGCNAFLGGISKNFEKNIHISDSSDLVVIEADEYDRSFLTLSPYMAAVTSADADHLDIYGTEEEYLKGFEDFVSLVRPGGVLVMKYGLPIKAKVAENVTVYTYSRDCGDFHAENVVVENGDIFFDFVHPQGVFAKMKLGVPVDVNVENGVVAMALAMLNGATEAELRAGLASYAGVKRRFEFHLKKDGLVFIDDYAHHPEELKASIDSISKLYPGKKVTVVFQPHLYSRTRDFADDFAKSLSKVDELILLDIYPARELPIEGVSSQMLLDKVSIENKRVLSKQELVEYVKNGSFEVFATIGAGDVDRMIPQLKQALEEC